MDTASQAVTVEHRRGPLQRVLRALGWTFIVVGLLVLGFLVQQLFVTTWLAGRAQGQLEEDARERFATVEVARVPASSFFEPAAPPLGEEGIDTTIDEAAPIEAERTILVEEPPELGEPFAIIRIPKIEKLREGWTVVEGVRISDLKNGAGHMPTTPLPGQPGNAVISGHRTTYGAPFYDLDVLEPGDRIEVETAIGVSVYEVREVLIVKPTDLWVTDPRPGAWLTLTTCNPRFSARERLVVFAELVEGPNFEAIYG